MCFSSISSLMFLNQKAVAQSKLEYINLCLNWYLAPCNLKRHSVYSKTVEKRVDLSCISLCLTHALYICQLVTTITVDGAAPGLKTILSFKVPDQRSGKVTISYVYRCISL